MARQKPSEDFSSKATNIVASIIGDLVEKSTQGDIIFEGQEGVLTVALGTNEHPGRIHTTIRGVGFKKFFGKNSRLISVGVSQDDILALQKRPNANFQHKLQKDLKQ
ncbi:unnamed protein product [Lathyrus sativus]|nr:unnamed protein product [Lathyrus sativus]